MSHSLKSMLTQIAALRQRKGFYVESIDIHVYHGPSLVKWDYFSSTKRASQYIGCNEDEVAVSIRENEMIGRGRIATVMGVKFIPATEITKGYRPPLENPQPRKNRWWVVRRKQMETK